MKRILFTIFITLFFLLASSMLVLSTIGFETEKFNDFITNKIKDNKKNITVRLKNVKFKFDFKGFNLFLETKNPELTYKDLTIPIQNVKVYLNFISLIKSKTEIDKINILSNEINIDKLKKIIIKTKPSNLNSLIINRIKKGRLVINLELYFKDNLEIDNFIAKGEVKKMEGDVIDDLRFKNTNFNFFADSSDILIKNINSKMEGLSIKNGNIQIKKDKEISIKSDFITEVNINKKNIISYSPFLKNFKFINQETNFNGNLNNFLNINFDQTFKVTNFVYSNKGEIKNLTVKLNKSIKNSFLEKDIENLYLKNSNFDIRYASDKKDYIYASGLYSIDNKNYQNYDFKNDLVKEISNVNLNFEFVEKLKIDFINYTKKHNEISKLFLNFSRKKDFIDLKKLEYKENKSLIVIENLKIKKKDIISLKKITVKTFDKNDLKNDFILEFGKGAKISGYKYDANNLNKFLNQKSKKNILNRINKEIEIDLKKIDTPLSKGLTNFRLIGTLQDGKFIKISSKGDFGDNKFLDISMKSDKKNKKKYLEIYSDLPQPLLSEYSFFKGLLGGVLTFTSIIDGNTSSSRLIIDNFKIVNAPGVVKLLSLADFGGLADLAEGEGLSFEKMEINMTSDGDLVKLNELYAVGPSISVLMEGYKEDNGLTSLRGTLVPAKNLNKFLSKIPVIGKIIIPKDVGEGLFGVSFKMKGMPGKIKTSINPIKTLTPRFITKALERQKNSK